MHKNVKAHLSKDPTLQPILASVKLKRLEKERSIYSDFLGSIMSQQLSTKAAATIKGRFLDLFPNREPKKKLLLKKSIEELRAVGLSRQKATYVQNVAQFFLDEKIDEEKIKKLSDEEIIAYFTQIKGVGRWTVQMILMFTLRRPDVFPVDDLGVIHGMRDLYGIKKEGKALKEKCIKISDKWAPYRSYGSRLMWRWKDA